MTTTQTQVTGPVDDADLKALIDAVDEFHTDLSVNADMHSATISHYTAKINARLAPRADALIERDQVHNSVWLLINHADGYSFDHPESGYRDVLTDQITDAVMALLPRAPMPDVVTISREVLEQVRDYDVHDGISYDTMAAITAALEGNTNDR